MKNNISRYLIASIPLLLAIILFFGTESFDVLGMGVQWFAIPFLPLILFAISALSLIWVLISISIAWYLYFALCNSYLKIGRLNLEWFAIILAIAGFGIFYLFSESRAYPGEDISGWFFLMGIAGIIRLIYKVANFTYKAAELVWTDKKATWASGVTLIVVGLIMLLGFGRFNNFLGDIAFVGFFLILAGLGTFILSFIDWVKNKKK